MAPRALANSAEAAVTTVALYYWPASGSADGRITRIALAWAAVATLLRPTAALTWAILGLAQAWSLRARPAGLVAFVVRDAGVIGCEPTR